MSNRSAPYAWLPLVALVLACGPPKVMRVTGAEGLARNELAVIRVKRAGPFAGGALSGFKLNVAVIAVDGQRMVTGDWVWQAPPDLEIAPGPHTLVLALDMGGNVRSNAYPRVPVVLEAGHVYELAGKQVPGSLEFGWLKTRARWQWWITDTTTGKTIAESGTSARPAESEAGGSACNCEHRTHASTTSPFARSSPSCSSWWIMSFMPPSSRSASSASVCAW